MQTLRNILIAAVILTLFSCEEDKKIDMSKLNDYYFEFTQYYEFENDHIVTNDTIIYSFEDGDTALAIRYQYLESIGGIDEFLECDTAYSKYIISGNKVMFGYFELPSIGITDYLFNFKWEVLSISDDQLKIKIKNDYSSTESVILKSIPK